MTTPNRTESFQDPLPLLQKSGTWLIVTAIGLILVGTLAVIEPLIAGLTLVMLVGWLLLIGGVIHGISAFRGGGVGHVIWQIIVAVLYVAVGLYFLAHPSISLSTLTLFLSGVLFAEALVDVAAFFSTAGEAGAGWLLVDAAITFLLAAMIRWQWPSSSVWVVGTLVGVNLIIRGFSRLMLGIGAKSLFRTHAA